MMSLKNMVRGLKDDSTAKQLIQFWEYDAKTLKFWRASSNFIYMFERNGDRYFLRFIHEEDNSIENIQAELDFLLYLIAEGYPAAAPVPSKSGKWIETIHTVEDGCYYGVVFEQAKGIHLPLDQMTDRHVVQWGMSLASLHILSERYPSRANSRGSWNDALSFISSVLQRHPGEHGARKELEQLRIQLSALPTDAKHMGIIHYDFETDNIFYEAEKSRYHVIDFDDAMIHWYAMDIASAISDLVPQEDDHAKRKIKHFLTGYQSVKPLEERYVHLLPVFHKFADLYTMARLLRSVEDVDLTGSPEWADRLKHKLLGVCERIGERCHPSVELKPVDENNWYECTELEVTDEQKNVFPVPVVYWLAESAYCGFTPLAVYTGEQLIGFAVYAVDPDDGSYWIMAYMIDHKFQHKGLGRSGMKELVRYIHDKHGCDKIVLGHRAENERASHLYASLGFEEVSREGIEIIRELTLS
ncbi:GNAT family N-acetyltransferase [Paenibacillus sp. UNC499MF]|uniref:GNAT family N-acetyltransferase n=1 Tax=Paenibacillus sp. UNC499MF TaxID=1502751 RepID=UPI0008A06390|nr:GNAT family N-acetyltransferase [Paenibacillus sp. UNC499MF]SEG77220.1 Ser/Thr protein kinase RdoA involved in Cpx stress response, MazF antagonist [Paenibacillus sp. UNC499MF]